MILSSRQLATALRRKLPGSFAKPILQRCSRLSQ